MGELESERTVPDAMPAFLVAAVGLAVVALRPAIPIDETRYLEVFREHLLGKPLLLRLAGEPYAEKPPLLFWLGRLLAALGFPHGMALRVLPPLAAAATVAFVARIGRRAELPLAGWVQAVLLLPVLSGQMLLFDSLLAACVWGALDAWVRRRDIAFGAWSAAALLAKGPVALLFLVALPWALAPLRGRADARRTAGALGLALVPLAAWALASAAAGGEEYARALLWGRWAGRVTGDEHARPFWFYLPLVLVGALPASFVLLARRAPSSLAAPAWSGRLVRALLVVLALFTLFRGKQAQYLVPLAPALALLVAQRLESEAPSARRLRRGVLAQAGLFVLVLAAGAAGLPRALSSLTPAGRERIASGAYLLPLGLAAAGVMALGWFAWRASSARALLGATALGTAALLPLHWLGGKLLYPHALAAALRGADAPVACLGPLEHGLVPLLAERTDIVRLSDEDELSRFAAANPEALLVVDASRLTRGVPAGLVRLAEDTVHRKHLLVLRHEGRGADAR